MRVDMLPTVSFSSFSTAMALVAFAALVMRWMQARKDGSKASRSKNVRTMVVLGSGGHTTEILAVVARLNPERYAPRCYVSARTDRLSEAKAKMHEAEVEATCTGSHTSTLGSDGNDASADPSYVKISRSREVGQSYLTSVYSTLRSIAEAVFVVLRFRPELLLCNGPGTCIPLCLVCYVGQFMGLGKTTIVYVESIARVKSLSLTGKLLYRLRIADRFFVQWEGLMQRYPRCTYAGRTM